MKAIAPNNTIIKASNPKLYMDPELLPVFLFLLSGSFLVSSVVPPSPGLGFGL